MLSLDWNQRKAKYDFIVIGSGYGGAITAARLANATLNPKPSICILERGREWPVGTFPDTQLGAAAAARNGINPLGLYELLVYRDITVIKGSGLGGTSLINANVAIIPDREVFEQAGWPKALNHDTLLPYYRRARQILAATPHPRAIELEKVQALDRRARQLGLQARPLYIAVNFAIDGKNPHGVDQKPCIDCGDCVSGCNVGAKNTLYMNYLPMARNGGAEIFTQTKVEWIEKAPNGGWRVRGRHYRDNSSSEAFTLEAAHVILGAGAINSTEILMRSQMHGLSLSPAIGTGFSGNGDFFGVAYNSDYPTDVLGFGNRPQHPGAAHAPGPSIVGVVRYNGGSLRERITIQDLSFPSAAVDLSRAVFAAMRGEDSDAGDEQAERARIKRDTVPPLVPNDPAGALNHSMLYLVMGMDDARGTMVFDAPWFEPDGRMRIEWDDVGRQQVFTRINEELRRHARALGASFIENPIWSFLDVRHLITAHPLGGCPIAEDYLQGAVDPYGRVFAGDGGVHPGLFVADGALVPSALGVNPFLTISALAEHIVERKIEQLQGNEYPAPPAAVSFAGIDPVDVSERRESQLEKLFRWSPSQSIDVMINNGGRQVDTAGRRIRNDEYWKGFFPKGHVLNRMSSAIFTGFKKRFFKQDGRVAGITSDTDGRINARNALEEIRLTERKGDLDPGRYVLLHYIDPPWQGFYDVFKIINEDLLVARVYLGEYPNGIRMFTFPMTRRYSFEQMTVEDHKQLFGSARVPTKADLNGVWRMDVISNANHAGGLAYLKFDLKPDGRLEARYQLMGLIEGLILPTFTAAHFRLDDFTTFHDEIRVLDRDLLIGKYVTEAPAAASLVTAQSLGVFHGEPGGRVGFYYLLTRADRKEFPRNTLLRPFLDVQLPDGLSMTFDEEMEGWYEAAGAGQRVDCRFRLRMSIRDVNEFVDGVEHEARAGGELQLQRFEGEGPVIVRVDDRHSFFNYLRVNPETGEAEMRYHLEFHTTPDRRFVFEGRKYMQKDRPAGGARELLDDYTTLFYTIREGAQELGRGELKFRTFEDLAAVGNFAGFLRSFQVTGTDDPVLKLQAQMRFLAFTAQFAQQEHDPLAPQFGAAAAGGGG